MKRAMSENNSESEDNVEGTMNLSSGGGSNASHHSNNNNNNNNRGQKRFRNEETIRLLIPSRFAGGIIGKGGQNIKRLRQEFNANINVEDCPGPERTVNISAPELNNALKVIEDVLHNNFGEADSEIDLRLLIHQSLAGCVIGKGGGKIKEIRDKVGCRILKVFSNMCPQSSDRVVQCIGKAKECMDAISDILMLIKEVPIKGSIQNYDPINYDDYLADKYGGFGGDSAGNGGNRGNNNNNNNRGGGGGGGNRGDGGNGGQGRNNRDRSFERRDNNRNFNRRNDGGGRGGNNNMRDRDRNNFINPWASNQGSNFDGSNFNQFGNNGLGGMGYNNFNNPNNTNNTSGMMNGFNGLGNNPNLGGNNAFDNNMGGNNGPVFGMNNNLGGNNNLGNNMPNNLGNNGQNDEGRETTQVTIPKDLAGAIIGKAGTRIRRIRMESNAFITIDEPAQGSTDRIITISGTARQIQLAQYLLQQSVREHRRN